MIQSGPKVTQNYPKWPKNDARIYALFPQFFFDWKSSSANFFAFRMYDGDRCQDLLFALSPIFLRILSLVFHFIVLSITVLISISITSLLIVPRNIYGNHILCKLIWIASRRVFQSFDWTIISSRMRLASIMPSTNCKSDTNMCKS